MKGIFIDSFYSVFIMEHLDDLHQCSSSTSESSNQNHFNVESPPILSPHIGHSLSDSQVLLGSLPPHLSPVDNYKFRDLLFPPKSPKSLYCRSEISIVNNGPVELSTRLNQSCPQLTTRSRQI